MPIYKSIVGEKVSSIRILREFRGFAKSGKSVVYCEYICDCGQFGVAIKHKIIARQIKSCGCKKSELVSKATTKHGLTKSGKIAPEYAIWKSLKARCENPSSCNYKNYGGRGIKRLWKSVEEFYQDMGPRPSPTHQIDRSFNDGHYEASNCQWQTAAFQNANKRTNRFIEYGGEKITVSQASKKFGLNKSTILYRLKSGWSAEKILTTPVNLSCRAKSPVELKVICANNKKIANNRKTNRFLVIHGEKLSMSAVCEKYKLPYFAFRGRLDMGWSLEKALTIPFKKLKRSPAVKS